MYEWKLHEFIVRASGKENTLFTISTTPVIKIIVPFSGVRTQCIDKILFFLFLLRIITLYGRHTSGIRKKRAMRMNRRIISLLLIVALLCMLSGCSSNIPSDSVPSSELTVRVEGSAIPTAPESSVNRILPAPIAGPLPTESDPLPPEIRVTLTAVGDIIMHKPVTDGGRTNPGQSPAEYDYSYAFQYIRPIFQESDLAIGNFEGTMAGPPYTGFPHFCGPDEIADALYEAGFRVMCTANNHCIDKGLDGLVRTASVFKEKGFTVIGTRPDENSPIDAIVDISGIQVGLISYTFESIGTKTRKALNGIPLPEGSDPLINSFNPNRTSSFENDMEAIVDDIERLRREGAEFICFFVHWGTEYTTRSSAWQQDMAMRLCDAGVGLIIGHHPHVLQEIDVLVSEKNGNQTLVYYSTGNFFGNWAFQTLGTYGKTQDGMIARVTILKTKEGVRIEKGEYIPTFVVRTPRGPGMKHYIIPSIPASKDPEHYRTTETDMLASVKRVGKILSECVGTQEIPIFMSER